MFVFSDEKHQYSEDEECPFEDGCSSDNCYEELETIDDDELIHACECLVC